MDQETLNDVIMTVLQALAQQSEALQKLVALQEFTIEELRAINKKLYTLNGITSRIENS